MRGLSLLDYADKRRTLENKSRLTVSKWRNINLPLKIFWRNSMEKYLRETKMLDYSSENIQQLIRERSWNDIEEFER